MFQPSLLSQKKTPIIHFFLILGAFFQTAPNFSNPSFRFETILNKKLQQNFEIKNSKQLGWPMSDSQLEEQQMRLLSGIAAALQAVNTTQLPPITKTNSINCLHSTK